MIREAVFTTLLTLLPLAAHAQYDTPAPSPSPEAAATASTTPSTTPSATPVEMASPTPTPAPAAAPGVVITGATKLKLGGVLYLFYRHDLTEHSGNVNGFDVGRAYLNVEPSWGDQFYARVTTDIVRETLTQGSAGTAAVNTTGSEVIRLKYGYLGYKILPNVDLRVGMHQTPFVSWNEELWGYRVLSPIAAEAYGMSSSDFGWSANVKVAKLLEIHAGAYNGETYQKPEANKFKDAEARVTISPFACGDQPGLRVTGFYLFGYKAQKVERSRAIGMLSWQDRWITAGVEYLQATDKPATGKTITGGGPTVFAVFTIPHVKPPGMKDLRLLARVDVFDPDHDKKKDGSTRIIAGVAARSNDKIQFILDYQQTDPEAAGAKTAQALFAHWEAKF